MGDNSAYLKIIGEWHINGPPEGRASIGGDSYAPDFTATCDTGAPGNGPPHKRLEPQPYFGEEIVPTHCSYCRQRCLPDDRCCEFCGGRI